jgi:hypothetical protein
MNLQYKLSGDDIVSEPLTSDRLSSLRRLALKKMEGANYSMRTCWNCNPAHSRFLEDITDDFLFVCSFGCGRYFFNGADITDDE